MDKPNLTIIAPWLSKGDWTGLIFSSLIKSANEKNISFNVIIGDRVDNNKKNKKNKAFDFLYPKLRVVEKMVSLANKNLLADRIVIIDSSFVNMKAIRYIAGSEAFISCFVNGGFFQKFDLDRQTIFGYDKELSKFEEGHYALMDKIFLPSKYALNIFLKAYPLLKNKSFFNYYFLKFDPVKITKFSDKFGYLYPSRQVFQKGYDVILDLCKKNVNIDSIIGLKNIEFRKKISRYKVVLIPSRADLFGFCALEAILEGTIPVVPKGFSYDELINIPSNFKLTLPINKNTKKEIISIIKAIEKLSESEYNRIIFEARNTIKKRINDKNHGFLSIIESVFYEKKK